MRNRRAILFFLVWSAAFALALATLSTGSHSAAEVDRGMFPDVDPDKVSGVEIVRAGKDGAVRILLSRVDGKWRMDSPIAAEADATAVKRVVDSVVFAEPVDELSGQDMVELGRTYKDFGLVVPRVSITIMAGGIRATCDFGRTIPSGEEVYVRRYGRSGTFTVAAGVMQELLRPIGDFRRRSLFTFAREDVSAVGFKSANGQFSKLVKTVDGWRLTEPVDAPADRQVVEELIGALCSANVIDYVARGGELAPNIGENEGYAISLRNSLGLIEKLVLGAASSTNAVWALTPEGASVHVDAGLLDLCRSRQRMLEDTRVFPVDMSAVLTFSIASGFPSYMLSRPNPAMPWRLASPVDAPADMGTVTNILSRLIAVRGVDLAAAGEDAKFVVSVGTATTNYPARTVSWRFLPEGMRLADLRDRLLLRYPRTEVRRIKVSTAAGAGWDATKSDTMLGLIENGIVAERVETVVFRAGDLERCGFDRPSFAIELELEDKESALRRLLLGAAAPGGGRYAMVGGSDAAFVLSATTVSVLTKPVEVVFEEDKKK